MEKLFGLHWPEQQQPHLFQLHEFNNSSFILPWPSQASTSSYVHGFPSSLEGTVEDRSLAASKSHSQAEKRRRERINGHLSTLRRLIPRSDKMDKAALLGSVVDQVKELKRKAVELGKVFTIPTDVDQVHVDSDTSNVDYPTNNKDCLFLKASLCCDDRPELFTDLIGALKGLKLRAVRAEMATLGGRIVSVMVLCTTNTKDGGDKSASLSSLKQSVKVVLSRVASLSMASTSELSSKRQRMLLQSN